MPKQREVTHLDRDQKLELARALFHRGREQARHAAKAALRKVYPTAPDKMIDTAVFHIYTDGIDAALEFIAAAEMFLRDPSDEWLGYGSGLTYELLSHVYNWHLFQYLLPNMKKDLIDVVDDLKYSVEAGKDQKEILKAIEDLENRLGGFADVPDFSDR